MVGELLGFIGTGRMGGPMASRLLDAGYSLCVYDKQAEATAELVARGALLARSPDEVASTAEIVLLSLPTPDILKAVALGENGVGLGNRVRTVIDLSTTGPGIATIVAQGLSERQIALIDSPVSGGIAGAKAGTLAVMVSGPRDIYEARVAPILKHFGKLFYTGDKPGLAQTAKLVNNLARRGGPGHLVGRHGDGRQGRSQSQGAARYHQCQLGPQQRDAGQVSAIGTARHIRFRLRNGAVLQGCPALPRRSGSDGNTNDHGRGRASDPGIDPGQIRTGFGFHLDCKAFRGVGRGADQRIAEHPAGRENPMDATAHPEHRSLSVARAMVRAARAVDLPDLSAAAQARLKICLLDFLSCAFEARDLPTSRQAIAAAAKSTSGSAIIGFDVAVDGRCGFANATLGHGLVLVEDMHPGSIAHHGVVIWPVLLALAQRAPVIRRTDDVRGGDRRTRLAAARPGAMTAGLAQLVRPTGRLPAMAGSYSARSGRRCVGLRARARCQHLVRP